jgi:elongation factor G
MIVINKIDADNLDLPGLVADIRERFGKQCLLLDLPAHGAADVVEVLEHDAGDADFESVAAAHRALIDQIVEEDETCSPSTSKTVPTRARPRCMRRSRRRCARAT